MADDRIDIEIVDKISADVPKKIKEIADEARKTFSAVEMLKAELNELKSTGINQLTAEYKKLSTASLRELQNQNKLIESENRAAISKQKLLAETQKVNAATAKSGIENQKLSQELAKTKIHEQKVAIETQKAAQAQSNAAAAASRAAAANTRAQITTIRLEQAQRRASGSTRQLNTDMGGYVRTALAYAGAYLGGREIVSAGDAYTLLNNKIKNVVDSEKQLNAVTEKVFDIANRTRTPVEETAQAFQRFDKAMMGLGASQDESLRLTETVNKQLAISGAAVSEQSSALLQLSQAFNKGKLDGDEFRTVMELMPGIADHIAKQLGVTRGELLKLAPEGKITADVMRKALAKAADEVDQKFAKLTPTIGQSFTVLKNNAVKFIGELNKDYKILDKFSNGILWASENLDVLGVAAATVAVTIGAAFTPRLIANVEGFVAALASNPTTLIVAGLAAVIGLLYIFRNDIKVTSDDVVSFGDAVQGTFSVIENRVRPLTDFIRASWKAAFSDNKKEVSEFTDYFENAVDKQAQAEENKNNFFVKALKFTGNAIKSYLNFVIAIYVATFKTISRAWGSFGDVFINIFKNVVNEIVNLLNTLIEIFTAATKPMFALINKIRSEMGKSKIDFGEMLTIPKLESSKKSITDLTTIIKEEFGEAFSTDYIGNFIKDVEKEARRFEYERTKNKLPESETRKAGKPAKTSSDGGKEKETYAQAIAKINRELNSQIKILGYLGEQQQVVQRFEQINNQLLAKKFVLSEQDKKQIIEKLQLIEQEKAIHDELNKIYQANIGESKKLNYEAEALNRAFNQGIINTNQFAESMRLLNNEKKRFAAVGGESKDVQAIYDQTQGALESIENQIIATNRAYQLGGINADDYANRILDLKLELIDLQLQMSNGDWADAFTASIAQVADGYKNNLTSMSNAFGGFFTKLSDGFADSIGRAVVYGDDLAESLKNVAKSAIAELISAIVKMGIQWVVTTALQKSAALTALSTTTIASVAAGAATAEAWAPAAAAASLASFGANSGPASAGVATVYGLSKSLASTPGFEKGGYTGDIARDRFAGIVHGQEFVLNANATRRIGVDNLNALQSGAATVQRPSENTTVYNNYQNNESGSNSQQSPQLNARIINLLDSGLVGDYLATDEGESVVVNVLRRNSDVLKQLVAS